MKFGLSLLMAFSAVLSAQAADITFYVGTYTKPGGSKGIYKYKLDSETGKMSGDLAAESASPSFLAIRPDRKALYAVNEGGGGSVSAFSMDESGGLQPLNKQSSKGGGPAHIWIDKTGKSVLVANYGGGSVAALPVQEDGSLAEAVGFIQHTGSSVHPSRQKGPHAHAIYTDLASTRAYVCDLGLDKVLIYKFDATGATLAPNDPPAAEVPPGSGPRHLAFDPNGKHAYVINELLNTVSVFTVDEKNGSLGIVETVPTLPEDNQVKNSTAEIFVHPSGKYVYGSNRGHGSIVAYARDEKTGKLTLIGHFPCGKSPRGFAIDPKGQWLVVGDQDGNKLTSFKIDTATGKLEEKAQAEGIGAPVCVLF